MREMSVVERLRAVAEEAVEEIERLRNALTEVKLFCAEEAVGEIERLRNALTELRDGDRFGIEAKFFAEHILNGDDR